MEPAIQYDFFYEINPLYETKEEIKLLRESLRKIQKKLFLQDAEMMKFLISEIQKKDKQIQDLNSRLDRLSQKMINVEK